MSRTLKPSPTSSTIVSLVNARARSCSSFAFLRAAFAASTFLSNFSGRAGSKRSVCPD